MTMVACKECGQQISSQAKACPHCGHRPPADRRWIWWVLGTPLALLLAFFAIGGVLVANTPAYELEARQMLRACKKAFPLEGHRCQQMFEKSIREGKAAAEDGSAGK